MKKVRRNEMANAVGITLEPSDWMELSQHTTAFAHRTEDHLKRNSKPSSCVAEEKRLILPVWPLCWLHRQVPLLPVRLSGLMVAPPW
jgi:hypothetical protein